MKGYFAFPPPAPPALPVPHRDIPAEPAPTITTPPPLLNAGSTEACAQWGNLDRENVAQEDATRKRHEEERALREHSEREWVRAGGVLRDTSGKRDKARTERIRQELNLHEVERQKMARWEAYEERWRATLSSAAPVTFVEFPWPLGKRVARLDLDLLTRQTISDFLFESLSVRTNTTTKRERIRSALLRWHPDKISFVLTRVAHDDVELVREGIHIVFGILKSLQDAERRGVL